MPRKSAIVRLLLNNYAGEWEAGDETPPVTTIALDPADPVVGDNWVDEVEVTLSATDDDSGVDYTEWSINGGDTWNTYTVPFMLDNIGVNDFWYRSADVAGNVEAYNSLEIPIIVLEQLNVAFSVDDAAPASSIVNDPTGQLDFVQLDSGAFAVSGGKLTIDSVPASGDINEKADKLFALSEDLFPREAGLVLKGKVNHSSVAANSHWPLGWRNAADGGAQSHGFQWQGSGCRSVEGGVVQNANINATISAATEYNLAVVLRANGAYHLIKGGAYTNWTLLWATRGIVDNPANMYAILASSGNPTVGFTYDDLKVVQLTDEWTEVNGIAVDAAWGAVSAGTTFVHEGNGQIQFMNGTISATTKVIKFRMQDANNYWQLTMDTTSTDLDEVVAGVATQRGTAAAVSSNVLMTISMNGMNIAVSGNQTRAFTYGSASNFASETDGEFSTGADISDLETLPRLITGAALTNLDAA